MNFYRMMAIAAIAAGGSWIAAAQAEETVIWWDFLGGGDGVRMKQLISDYNAAHAGKVKIDATTLEWGTPSGCLTSISAMLASPGTCSSKSSPESDGTIPPVKSGIMIIVPPRTVTWTLGNGMAQGPKEVKAIRL